MFEVGRAGTTPGDHGRGADTTDATRALRHAFLLALILLTTWPALALVGSDSLVAPIWPAAGLSAGLLLVTPRRRRPVVVAGITGMLLAAYLLAGVDPALAAALSLVCVAETVAVRALLSRGSRRRVALLEDGDVSRLIASTALGAALAAGGYAAAAALSSTGAPGLTSLAVFGTHLASLLILLPLFLPTPTFPSVASTTERVVRAALTLGITVVVFASSDVPPVVFAVMPLFAWLAFRGGLREASWLLALVAVTGTAFTVREIGPVWALEARYDLAPELVTSFLQLFLVDCALILLPVSVSVAQQRLSSAQATAGRATLERLVASATGTAIYATDRDGRIILFNPGAEAMLGYNLYEVLGERPDRFHPPEELARQAEEVGTGATFAEICRGVVGSGAPRRLWRFVRQNGEERTMLMTLAGVHDEQGEPSGYLATAEDVTEREEAQAALVQAVEHQALALERLEELDRTKSAFVSTVSHELRTPLTSIVGYTELLEDGSVGELSAEQRDLIGRVDRNGRRLLLLIEDLLTYSRLEQGALRMQPVDCDLRQTVAGAYEAMTATLMGRDLAVDIDLPRVPATVRGDPPLLERMVLNLLSNAVKFTPDGGTITALLTCDRDSVVLVVRDSGVGIPEGEVDQLFTRFFRSSTAYSRAIQGTGLGLSIVQGIVSQHGGEVGLQSVEGRGTTVTVTLPAAGRAPEVERADMDDGVGDAAVAGGDDDEVTGAAPLARAVPTE